MDTKIIQHIVFVDNHARIAGTMLKAAIVARMHVVAGQSIEAVMEQYNLNRGQVHAALAYYYDNREELEAQLRVNIQGAIDAGARISRIDED